MASVRASCCCGSSIEVHTLMREPGITQEWWSLHARCAVAWQKERGVHTKLMPKDEESEE
jgi:hypothetical protein